MAIYRDDIHEHNYLKIHNSTINSYESISIEAMGALLYFLAKPPGWQPSVSELGKTWGFGREKAARIMRELKEAGYVKKSQARSKIGQFVIVELNVFETPRKGSAPEVTLPDNVLHMPENPVSGASRNTGFPSAVNQMPENPCTDDPCTDDPFTGLPPTSNNRSINNEKISNNVGSSAKAQAPHTRQKRFDPIGAAINDRVNQAAWNEWWEHKGGKQTQGVITKNAKMFATLSCEQQQQMVDNSMRNGWKGLFPDKVKDGSSNGSNKQTRRRTIADTLNNDF